MTINDFIDNRLTVMGKRPLMWAGTTESFILQIVLLVEISWLEQIEGFHAYKNNLLRELCGKESGNSIPNHQLIDKDEWAEECVTIARKYLKPR